MGISDALEHVESEQVIRKLKQKDFSLILLLLFMGGRKIVQLIIKK
jgi:hypothetical protein